MPALSPSEALNTCERALRELMAHAFAAAHGPEWLDRISTADQREQWQKRAAEEAARRKSVVSVPTAGLDYSQFYELIEFADKHWQPLAPALGKKKATFPLLETFDNLRNTVAHDRQLYTHEADLYSGIAGTIRNQVTIYMSAQDEAGEYYPRITAARDSFGNEVDLHAGSAEVPNYCRTDTVLRPGDIVIFHLAAVDPQGRDIIWKYSRGDTRVAASGEEVAFSWTVSEDDVHEMAQVKFRMLAHHTHYHRGGDYDHVAVFTYKVRPPVGS